MLNVQSVRSPTMKLSKWKKDISYMTDKEIVQYYGQIWGNVKHIKSYVEELRQRYINELYGVRQ